MARKKRRARTDRSDTDSASDRSTSRRAHSSRPGSRASLSPSKSLSPLRMSSTSPTGFSAPSSLARPTSPIMAMSPSQRNADDIKRLKARAARRGQNPGPGTYSPTNVGFMPSELSGHYAFRSTTARTVSNLIKDSGDPGAYEPHIYLSLAQQASSSVSKSAKAGANSFGGNQARVLEFTVGTDTPGPATYNATVDEKGREWDTAAMSHGEQMKSWTFASTIKQHMDIAPRFSLDNPGPGAYDPKDHLCVEHQPGANPDANPISKVGRDARYVADSMVENRGATDENKVGPGSYDSHLLGSIGKELADGMEQSSRVQAAAKPGSHALGFSSRFAQHELPHESIGALKSATPGPGAYEIAATRHGAEQTSYKEGLTSAFKDGNVAKELKVDAKGDPGSYDPNHNREIAWQAKQTFREPARKGEGNFGASTARVLRIPADMARTGFEDETPGPAAYKPSLSHRIYVKSVTVFKSMVPQRGKYKMPTEDNPGPGAYDPKDHLCVEHQPGANPDSNIISKVGRDGRYVADSMVENRGATDENKVGPGSYDSHLPSTIAHDSQCAVERALSSKSTQPLGFASSGVAHVLPHEQQQQAKLAAVGPGSYSPEKSSDVALSVSRQSHNKFNLAGKANFGTFSAARSGLGFREQGDPGAYDPHEHRSIATTSRATSRKSDLEGKGQFGSQTARVLRLEGVYNGRADGPGFRPEKTPGPAAYKATVDEKGREWDTAAMSHGEQMKSWTFASTIKQHMDIAPRFSLDNPGPGAYDPKDHLCVEHQPGANPDANPISKVGRDARYVADSMVENRGAAGEMVGPGSYDPMVTMDGKLDTIGMRSEQQKNFGWTASFISSHIRSLWLGWFGDNDELNSA